MMRSIALMVCTPMERYKRLSQYCLPVVSFSPRTGTVHSVVSGYFFKRRISYNTTVVTHYLRNKNADSPKLKKPHFKGL